MVKQPSTEWQALLEALQRMESPQQTREGARAAWEAWRTAVRRWQKAVEGPRDAEAGQSVR
jgi:hypothetical protein